jgi:hypothetical protein
MAKNTYAADVAFLARRAKVIEIAGSDDARVAVVPDYQGRVMTSTLAGGQGASFGWINSTFIESGASDEHFNNYGGEDRFWLGPEGGQFALWFAKGEPFDLPHWKTPAGFNTGRFRVTSQGKTSVAMVAGFDVTNYSGTVFRCAVRRTVRMLGRDDAPAMLGAMIPDSVKMVGFSSSNTLVNAGSAAWTQAGGLLSIWILGQFKPLPRGKVIVPFAPGDEKTLGIRATTDYFGPLPAERCRVAADHLLFSCDGKYRSKLGISRTRARGVAGSYDPDARLLTIVQFNLPGGAAKLPYVNSLWKMQDDPFGGDVVNSYNDGEAAPGSGQLGPFYEIETSSPAAELAAGEAIRHVHRTFHFSGDAGALNRLAAAVLGVDLSAIA